jgi:putative Ca2+/H+ antiporter (TMEM165/GDT1 family)
MGDKTQLATVSLAIRYPDVLGVLMGTTIAMVAADAIGIAIGVVMRRHIPDRVIKWFAAAVFILYGIFGIYSALTGGAG